MSKLSTPHYYNLPRKGTTSNASQFLRQRGRPGPGRVRADPGAHRHRCHWYSVAARQQGQPGVQHHQLRPEPVVFTPFEEASALLVSAGRLALLRLRTAGDPTARTKGPLALARQ